MTIDYNTIFSIAPSVLIRYPEITDPNCYSYFCGYITGSYYLKHAEILRDLFLKNTNAKLSLSARIGLGITAAVVVVKWISEEDDYASEILDDFGLIDEVCLSKYFQMERVFLRAIDYRIHVEPEQLKTRDHNSLWCV